MGDWLGDKICDGWVNAVWWIRVGVGLVVFLFGLYGCLSLFYDPNQVVPAGKGFAGSFMLICLGLALMIAGRKSSSEKNGYHF